MIPRKIVAATGHRPNKLGGYSEAVTKSLYNLALAELTALQPTLVISGMALGWDQAVCKAALNLNIPVHAYIPFVGQESMWPVSSQQAYHTLLKLCTATKICSPGGYSAHKMQVRNECMVNDCNILLALWDGTSGGTSNCLDYARTTRPNVTIVNCWDRYRITYP